MELAEKIENGIYMGVGFIVVLLRAIVLLIAACVFTAGIAIYVISRIPY